MHSKRDDRTGKPVVFRLWTKPQMCDFHEFILIVLYFVAIGSFTADGGLLQPTGGVKTTQHKTRFSQCENLQDIQGIHVQVKSECVGTLTTIELMTRKQSDKHNNNMFNVAANLKHVETHEHIN